MIEEAMLELKEKVIHYSSFVLTMIKESINGLMTGDESLLSTVINERETEANNYEVELDEMVIGLIAKYQPRAKNLRTALMIMKMNNDLERIGDEAVNIAEGALFLIKRPQVKKLIDIPRMAEIAQGMLSDSMDAFIKEDSGLAHDVCLRDEEVDSLRDQVVRELVIFMIDDPSTVERVLNIMRIARALERIGDLSTNFGEDVVFMVEGKIIKHHLQEQKGDS